MKKYLFILAGLLCFIGQSQVEAKAVKLGRSVVIGNQGGPGPGPGPGPTPGPGPAFCGANCSSCDSSSACTRCKSNFYLRDGACKACPDNATCPGTETITCASGYFLSAGGTSCSACSEIPVENGTCTACQGNTCTNVSCFNGYVKSGTSCTAISFSGMSCVSGYRKVVSADRACCVPMCQGVSCVSGYTPTATSTGCCCQGNTTCSNGQIYNTKIGKCVSAVCPNHCTSDCRNGCQGCEAGYTLNYNTGMCDSMCSDAQIYNTKIGKCVAAVCPMHCADDCTHGCQSCESGYTLNYTTGMCDEKLVKPTVDACDGTSVTPNFCDNGLIRIEGRGCCPSNASPSQACFQCAVR